MAGDGLKDRTDEARRRVFESALPVLASADVTGWAGRLTRLRRPHPKIGKPGVKRNRPPAPMASGKSFDFPTRSINPAARDRTSQPNPRSRCRGFYEPGTGSA
jgi:hypothetical protein